MQYNQNNGLSSIKFSRLLMTETGVYNPLYSRPYVTNIDGDTLQDINRRVDNSVDHTLSGISFSGIANRIISPDATPGNQIAIPNGWSERRIRFILTVEVTTHTGNSFTYHFQGYTSHLGVTPQGNVDPRMEFIINSFVRVSRVGQVINGNQSYKDIVNESAHVINGEIHYQQKNKDMYLMRPSDIFVGIQSAYLEDSYAKNGGTNNQLYDTRISLGRDSVGSNRSNNLAGSYISNILNSFNTGNQLADFGQSEQDIFGRCRDVSYEAPIAENFFIRALSNMKGIPSCTTFTCRDLEKIDPNINFVTQYMRLGGTVMNQFNQTSQAEYWNGCDRTTLVATILSNAVPALAMDLMISNITFNATNHDIGGNVNINIIDALSLTNTPMVKNYELFKIRLAREILNDVSFNNQEMFALEMRVDVFGETSINISLNGQQFVLYNTPSFCDGLITPITTENKQGFFEVVNDLERLMNNVGENSSSRLAVNNLI